MIADRQNRAGPLTTDIAYFVQLIESGRFAIFAWTGWIIALAAAGAIVSDIALLATRQGDRRISYLSRFLDIPEDRIIALPPTTALWSIYARHNRAADAASDLPPGAPTLQAAYLVITPNGAAVVNIHNFDSAPLIADPDIAGHVRGIDVRPSTMGDILKPAAFPVMIEEDAAKRTNIVEYILKAKYRYGGRLDSAVLVRDEAGRANPPESEITRSGARVHALDFENPEDARDVIDSIDGGTLPDRDKMKRFLKSWAGRTTSPLRLIWRAGLAATGVVIIMAGDAGTALELALAPFE